MQFDGSMRSAFIRSGALLVIAASACATTTVSSTTWVDPNVPGTWARPGRVGGAAVGAAASQGSAERRTYQVLVRFDDGSYGTFAYGGYAPFRPGDAVLPTPQGLARG
jgi:hypothetical protein